MSANSKFTILRNFLLTARGAIILALSIYFLIGPVTQQHDIVAAVLSSSLIGVLILLLLMVVWNAFALDDLIISLTSPNDSNLKANVQYPFLIQHENLKVFPWFSVTVTPRFQENLLGDQKILLTPNEPSLISVTFPHRGRWSISEFVIELSDRLGFTLWTWRLSVHGRIQFEVQPAPDPESRASTLPIVSSRAVEGDMAVDLHNRTGDPFDLRRYEPADGVRKIVWKVFARTGELLSRHPEPSITPEGETIVFVVSTTPNDDVAASALDYLSMVEGMGIQVFVGCLGMGDLLPARSTTQAMELLIESTWSAKAKRAKPDFISFLSQCRQGRETTTISKIIIFGKISDSDSESSTALMNLSPSLEDEGLVPLFLILDREDRLNQELELPSLVNRWFLESSDQPTTEIRGPVYRETFYTTCLQHAWEIILA